MSKKARVRIIVGTAVAASLLLLLGGYSVYAANADTTQKFPPVIEKLITAFNLDRNKVGEVLDEYRQERQAQHKATFEDRLDRAVENGRITAQQKDAILKKMDEMQTKLEELKKIDDPEQRRAAMEKLRTDLQAWAKENGLKDELFWFGFGRHKGFGPGFGGPRGMGGFGPGHWGPPSDGSTPQTGTTESSSEL